MNINAAKGKLSTIWTANILFTQIHTLPIKDVRFMTEMVICAIEPFTSPVWGANCALFVADNGAAVPEDGSKDYISRCCRYAKHHGVYLIPERFVLMGYQCMCIISPDGAVLGAQKNIFRNTDLPGSKRSNTIEVVGTEFGGVYLCVDVDIFRPETVRIAVSMGAQFVICSMQISMADYNSGMVVAGPWNAAQSNHVYTVSVGNAFRCICAPRALTKNNDGFLLTPSLKLPMTANLASAYLMGMPQRFCLSRRLYAVHRGELVGD